MQASRFDAPRIFEEVHEGSMLIVRRLFHAAEHVDDSDAILQGGSFVAMNKLF